MQTTREEIIAAYATSGGQAGLSVLRISGQGSANVAQRIFSFGKGGENNKSNQKRQVTKMKGYRAAYGIVHYPDDPRRVIDECILTRFVAPFSYTGEEQVEISIHGGAAVRRQLLEAVLNAGARMAEPGEFTKRAFLNSKMDLTQAEAVMDLIQASTAAQQENALRQLRGDLKRRLQEVKNQLYGLLAAIEVDIEYPEYEDFNQSAVLVEDQLAAIRADLKQIVDSNRQGRILHRGLRAVLLGQPNTGKSSVLNALAGEEKAIVTEVAGTTRDVIEVQIEWDGLPLTIVDTAGLHESEDRVEQIGIERARQAQNEADLLLIMLTGTSLEGVETALQDEQFSAVHNKPFLLLLNKSDLLTAIPVKEGISECYDRLTKSYSNCQGILFISAKTKWGIDELKNRIHKYFVSLSSSPEADSVLTSERQRSILHNALGLVDKLTKDWEKTPLDIVSSGLRQSLDLLGEITGENVSATMIEEIFARFCIGK